MKPISALFLGATALTLGLSGLSVPHAQAASSGSSAYVHDVELEFEGVGPIIVVKNVSQNKHVSAVKLSTQGTQLDIGVAGTVTCAGDDEILFQKSEIYFGPVSLTGADDIDESATLASDDISVSSTKVGDNLVEAAGLLNQLMQVPFATIDSGPAHLRLDPVEEIEKKLQAHLQGGGTAADFFRNEQFTSVTRPISLAGWCRKNGVSKAGFETRDLKIMIRYEADPQVNDGPVMNPQHQFQEVAQPLEITETAFQPNMPHYVGQCPPAQDPKIRVTYKGTGEGFLRLRVKEGAVEVHRSNAIAYDSDNGAAFYDFAYPLTDRLQHAAFKNWATLNQTFNHHLNLEVQTRDVTPKVQANYASGDGWSEWEAVDQAIWRHRCTPKLGVPAAGGIGGYQQNGGANAGGRALAKPTAPARPARQQVTPEPAAPLGIQRSTTRPPRAN